MKCLSDCCYQFSFEFLFKCLVVVVVYVHKRRENNFLRNRVHILLLLECNVGIGDMFLKKATQIS